MKHLEREKDEKYIIYWEKKKRLEEVHGANMLRHVESRLGKQSLVS